MKYNLDKVLAQYKKERNEALFSLDEAKIKHFAAKWRVPMPLYSKAFWGGIYKAVLAIPECPNDVQKKAKAGLKELGMSEKIGGWGSAYKEEQ